MDFILDLKTVNLSKAEFINLLMNNQLFTILGDLFDERKEEDEDFYVFFILSFFFSVLLLNFFSKISNILHY